MPRRWKRNTDQPAEDAADNVQAIADADATAIVQAADAQVEADAIEPSVAAAAAAAPAPQGAQEEVDLASLLRVGPVVEEAARAEKARSEKSRKGQMARDAHECLNILEVGGYDTAGGDWVDIKESVKAAVKGSFFYDAAGWRPAKLGTPRFKAPVIEVWHCTVLAASEELVAAEDAGKLGVLNFASARNPGGGFTTGAVAQEESIARSSALYPCLTKHFDNFFTPSRAAPSGIYTSAMIYSLQVPVVRDDKGQLLDKPYLADFLTAAAPNFSTLQRRQSASAARSEAEAALRERIPRVFNTFAAHGATDLVLGAWGCGVFGNDPATVARLFADGMRGCHGHFRRIVFAVLDPEMARVFGETLGVEVRGGFVAQAQGAASPGKGARQEQRQEKRRK